MHITVIHHVLILGSMGIHVRVVTVMTLVVMRLEILHDALKHLDLNRAIDMMDNLVLSMLALASVLVGPKELLVGGKGLMVDGGVHMLS